MLPVKSCSVRTRLAAPAMTSFSWRLAAIWSISALATGATRPRVRSVSASGRSRSRVRRVGERQPGGRAVDGAADLGDVFVAQVGAELDHALLDGAGVGDQHAEQPPRCQRHELDVPDARARDRRILHERDLVGELREQPDRAREHVVEVDGLAEEHLDRLPLRGLSGRISARWSTKSR